MAVADNIHGKNGSKAALDSLFAHRSKSVVASATVLGPEKQVHLAIIRAEGEAKRAGAYSAAILDAGLFGCVVQLA